METEFELKEIENDKDIRTQDAKLHQMLQELKRRCKGYHGQLFELIKPINQKYDTAVRVALRKHLRYLVVDTVETSKYCTEFLKEKGLSKELMVLENVPQPKDNTKVSNQFLK